MNGSSSALVGGANPGLYVDGAVERTNGDGTKTYANLTHGFAITYPDDWRLLPDHEDVDGGVFRANAPTLDDYSVTRSVIATPEDPPVSLEEAAAEDLRSISRLTDYAVTTRRDVTLGGSTPARIVDGTFRRSDGTLSTHKLMSAVSPTGQTSYHVNLVASPDRYEADDFAETVETVFTSFEVR